MKIPLSPPAFDTLMQSIASKIVAGGDMMKIMDLGSTDEKGRYLHWDKLRHIAPPDGLTVEEWWAGIKLARLKLKKLTGFHDNKNCALSFCVTDEIELELHLMDKQVGSKIKDFLGDSNKEARDAYIVKALFDEAITSSQLEGASTTRAVAREMLSVGRKPVNISEQMIYNNYNALVFIKENLKETITPEMIFELHKLVTDKTLDDHSKAGSFRGERDNIVVFDNSDGTQVHVPPPAASLPGRLKKLCDFANETGETRPFIHPLLRAILAHFILAYDHPFYDGNGRTARALFYWVALKNGYWLVEYLSISAEIMRARRQYDKSFLLTETDECDTTYFILFQIEIVKKAIDKFYKSIEEKAARIMESETVLGKLRQTLNYRQMELLRHALKHDNYEYTIEQHRVLHNISYNTARTDLLELYKMELLKMRRRRKKMIFLKKAKSILDAGPLQ